MKLFLDTADIKEIKRAAKTGMLDGVTTNPTLIAKAGRKFLPTIKEIVKLVDGPISVEVTALDAQRMVNEALPLAAIHKNITIKVPMTEQGLQACQALRKKGIKVNVTLVFHLNQALLAAKAGATFVSPFVGRLDDIGVDGMAVVEEIIALYANYDFSSQVLVASVRNPEHVRRAALMGADIATVPPEVFHKLFEHHLTDVGIERFLDDWKKAKK